MKSNYKLSSNKMRKEQRKPLNGSTAVFSYWTIIVIYEWLSRTQFKMVLKRQSRNFDKIFSFHMSFDIVIIYLVGRTFISQRNETKKISFDLESRLIRLIQLLLRKLQTRERLLMRVTFILVRNEFGFTFYKHAKELKFYTPKGTFTMTSKVQIIFTTTNQRNSNSVILANVWR